MPFWQPKTILKTKYVNQHELTTKDVYFKSSFSGELIKTVEVLVTTIFGKFLNVICIVFAFALKWQRRTYFVSR